MTYTLELFRTTDGLRLMELPKVPFSWSMSVRDANMEGVPDNLSDSNTTGLHFSLDALATVIDLDSAGWQERIRSTLTPTKHGIMALWDGVPIVGGPIATQVDIDRSGVSLSVGSYWDILARRYVVPEDNYRSDRQISQTGQQLYSIARYIIQTAMSKRAGFLPIVLPEWAYGSHMRTWQAFNVSNLGATKLLEEMSDVEGGPDLLLRPRVASDQRFEWVLHYGTDLNPHIGQTTINDWEELSESAGELTATLSSAYVAHRVYGVGDGSDIGTHTVRVDSEVPPEWPLLESVASDSNITAEADQDKSRLRSYARGYLNAYPVVGLRLPVRADGVNALGTYWPGEIARITTRGNPALPDGSYGLRILSISGGPDGVVELEFDPMLLEAI